MIKSKKIRAIFAAGIFFVLVAGATGGYLVSKNVSGAQNTSETSDNNDTSENKEYSIAEYEDDDYDASWDINSSTVINLSDSSTTVKGSGATFSDNVLTITSAGTYVISGKLSDGQIVVNCTDKANVHIVLNNADITSSDSAAILVLEAKKKVVVTLAENTTNTVTDNTRTTDTSKYKAVIYSKDDIVFNGTGTLVVNANYYHGIKGNDDLKIISGTYVITSKQDGINCNDSTLIKDGNITINAGDDGIHSDYALVIDGGNINIKQSYEGLESLYIIINDGNIDVTSSDDGLNATNGSSQNNMMGGNGGFGGQRPDNSSNSNSQNNGMQLPDNSSMQPGNNSMQMPDNSNMQSGGSNMQPGNNGMQIPDNSNGNAQFNNMQQETSSSDSDSKYANYTPVITINGGTVSVNASGDGIDSNGNIVINGGTVIVNGPTSDGDSAIDFDGTCEINGGTVMAFGSSGMLETPSSATNGCVVITTFSGNNIGQEYTLKDESGNVLLSYTPVKNYSAAIVYSTSIKQGSTYTVSSGSSTQSISVNSSIASTYSGMGGMRGGNTNGGNMNGGNANDGNMNGGNANGGSMNGGNSSGGRRN